MEDSEAEERVRQVALGIGRGEVMSYGEIGRACGLNPRHVGRIVSRISETIPWWRIVRSDGTPPTCHGGTAGQLLRDEDVPFRNGKVDRAALG